MSKLMIPKCWYKIIKKNLRKMLSLLMNCRCKTKCMNQMWPDVDPGSTVRSVKEGKVVEIKGLRFELMLLSDLPSV